MATAIPKAYTENLASLTGLRGDRQMPDALKNPPKTGFWRHTESSIRTHEAQAQTWGVNFQRTIRRRNEPPPWPSGVNLQSDSP